MTDTQIHASISEDNGIAVLTDAELRVYSVGISTGGVAEIRMAEMNPQRHITATTIDQEGVEFAKKYIHEQGFEQQIETKTEDVTMPLPYGDGTFDYVYARLVLHYLSEQGIIKALSELHRILKSDGKLFVVVRSTKCPSALRTDTQFDPATKLTTYIHTDKSTHIGYPVSRYFHTEDSISGYVADAGFSVRYVKSYDEQLFADFKRTVKASKQDNVIELLAVK